eukprot:gnl/TRDRNA2_/TRDRNA2_136558_c0_seq1.p1 gnl/TRDRNA2_/TRDRNA2_136558_c0~~gnl/TRDRNA2_/TRDRNA2_136558_c0_seq1.p1  ORF type:complete len:212 (-),score=34.76 gnl/TRDRNA2_/TRDRNA2_136558_c0_seq1:97-732(-)
MVAHNGKCLRVSSDAEAEAEVEQAFALHGDSPFAWWVEESGMLAAALRRRGLIECAEEAMVRLGGAHDELLSAQLPDALELHVVASGESLADFGAVMKEFDEAAADFYPMVSVSEEWPARFVVGYVGRVPVCAGSIYWDGAFCGLYDVATCASFRCRGFGSAVLQHLLLLGQAEFGAERFCLSADCVGGGIRIYERQGFRALGRLACFERR